MKSMKIGTRLGASIAIIVTVLAAVILMGSINLGDYVTASGWNVHTYKVLGQTDGIIKSLTNIETGQRGFLVAGKDEFLEPLNDGKAGFIKAFDEVKFLTSDNPKQQARLEKLKATYDSWLRDAVETSISKRRSINNNYAQYSEVVAEVGSGKTGMDAMRGIIKEIAEDEEGLLESRSITMETMSKNTQNTLLFGGIFGAILAALLGVFITRSITKPISKCIEVAEKVAAGDTSVVIAVDSQDETGMLMAAMKKMVDTINNLVVDMKYMSTQHDLGDIDIKVDVSKFQGAFKEMGEGVNAMVFGHIAVKKKAMACVAEFGKGNFDAELEKFPGKKVFINETIERVRSIIKLFIFQMKHMSEQHDLGDIDVSMEVDKFDGSYKVMASGVNAMVFGHIAVKKKAMACIAEFGKGNFDAELEKFPGKKVFINNTIEGVRTNLKNVAKELVELIEASKSGQLSRRGNDKDFQGDWSRMIAGVNQILDAILMPIQEAAQVLDKVAARDMTARVKGDYKGDHAKIKVSLNLAVENLDKALMQVSDGAAQVASASEQISAGAQAQAQGANEQASSLEEVSSSLEEMASMTRQNADSAMQAKSLSGEADQYSKTGAEAMTRMSTSINRIKESSDQTAKIVKTIDEIAMQTNLLALNAAVEAARAGEAGRGFAVVAEEVRNLAQRSAQAAKNTADMIGESVKNADDGVKIAVEVSKSFDQIATSAKKVNDLIGEIAAASKEQSQGIEQVNVAVSQMDKLTQQNAANSEESASASEELSSQAQELQAMVAQFALSVSTSTHAPRSIGVHHAAPRAAIAAPIAHKSSLHKEVPKAGKRKVSADDVIPMDDDALKEF